MGRVGEPLLLDEGVVVQPVEQLRAIGGDHLRLRIVDVHIDQPGHDERARMIVERRVRRGAGKNVARLADRRDPPVLDENRPVLDITPRGGAGLRRIGYEGEDPSSDDPICAPAHARIS